MNGWLIYNEFEKERNAWYINKNIECGKELKINFDVISYENIHPIIENSCFKLTYNGKIITDLPDFVICRCPDNILTKHFEYMNIPVFNNYFISDIANDKFKTYQFINSLGIKTLKTIYYSHLCEPSFYPCVIKPVDSKGGNNVYLLNDVVDFNKIKNNFINTRYVVQEVANDIGKDVRVYVINKKIIIAMLRTAQKGFKSNYCLGGTATIYNLSENERKIIQKVIDNLDIGFIGIDFVFHNNEIIFNEIEDVVGSRMVYNNSDIDIVKEYLISIKEQLQNKLRK